MRRRRYRKQDADLDITSFMNLMIILVPVLLMSMVFSHITVLDLKLPDLSSAPEPEQAKEDLKNETIELIILPNELLVNFPAGVPVKRLPKIESEGTGDQVYDFVLLSDTLQELKRRLKNIDVDKDDILILSQPDTDYQTIVKAMDTVRSFKAVLGASVVDAELFPVISLGDAPANNLSSANKRNNS